MDKKNNGLQDAILQVEHALIKVAGKSYYNSASAIETLVVKYVAEDKRLDFLRDLKELINTV